MEETILKDNYLQSIIDICGARESKDDCTFYAGSSLKKLRKFPKIQKFFGIPESDEVYFIYDSTNIRPNKRGFALCSSGVYYRECDRKKQGKITWNEFKMLKIYSAGKDHLFIGKAYIEALDDAKDVAGLLQEIQSKI